MPTREEFESAADKLRAAAEQVGELIAEVRAIDASEILIGGSLGRQVPERIAGCADSAERCRTSILEVEALCLERALRIVDYEVDLGAFDRAYGRYESELGAYWRRYDEWYHGGGEAPHPGREPVAPTAPAAPPAWADVRRP